MKKACNYIHNDEMKTTDWKYFVENELFQKNEKLIYLTQVGSQLYGTDDENSDTDLKGVFVPDPESILLKEDSESYGQYSTDFEDDSKDVDIEFWSIYKFLSLLKSGDTNAFDLLFGIDKNLVMRKPFYKLYKNRDKFLLKDAIHHSFIGYAYAQVKKYRIKGYNFQTLKYILNWFENHEYEEGQRLEYHVEDLQYDYYRDIIQNKYPDIDDEEKTAKLTQNIAIYETSRDTFLRINDHKKYPVGIRVKQFLDSIRKWEQQYGDRVRNGQGVDWKSLYHAKRSLYMAEELSLEGDLQLPLYEQVQEELKYIKYGERDFEDVLDEVSNYVDEVSSLIKNSDYLRESWPMRYVKTFMLDLYNLKEEDLYYEKF
mgnify:CR=1 FL=1